MGSTWFHRQAAAVCARGLALGAITGLFLSRGPQVFAGPYINNWCVIAQESADSSFQFAASKFKVAFLVEWAHSKGITQAAKLKSYNPNMIVMAYANVRAVYPNGGNWSVIDGVYPGAQTTLAADIGANNTTIGVADGSGFPTSNFWIKIDNEIIEIASRSGNTLTVKPYPNDPQPDKSGRGIATISGAAWQAASHARGASVYWPHEDWWLHDRDDGSRFMYGRYGWYHMDVASPGWREEFARHVLSHLTANYDGALGDDCWRDIAYTQGTDRLTRVSDGTYGHIPDAKVASFHNDQAEMLRYVKSRFGSRLLYFNGLHGGGTYTDYLAATDGAWHEEFVHGGTKPVDWFPTYATWQELLERLVYTQSAGKTITCYNRYYVVPPADIEQKSHFFSLATYLLGCGPTSYFDHIQEGLTLETSYYPIWDAAIGTPTGAYYQAGGVYQRDFTNGKALVNPLDSGNAVTVTLSRPYRVVAYDGSLSASVTSVSLATKTGVILIGSPVTMSVSTSASPSTAAPQTIIDYTVTYRNTAASPVSDVVVSSYVPSNTDFVPGSALLNGSPISPDPVTDDGHLVVSVGNVSAGAEGNVTFKVRVR